MENIDNMTRHTLEALARDNLTEESRKKLRFDILSDGVALISPLAGSILHNFGAFAVLLNSSRILKNQ